MEKEEWSGLGQVGRREGGDGLMEWAAERLRLRERCKMGDTDRVIESSQSSVSEVQVSVVEPSV
jgi:hypothetical protein